MIRRLLTIGSLGIALAAAAQPAGGYFDACSFALKDG